MWCVMARRRAEECSENGKTMSKLPHKSTLNQSRAPGPAAIASGFCSTIAPTPVPKWSYAVRVTVPSNVTPAPWLET